MNEMDIVDVLNAQYGAANRVTFFNGPGDLPMVRLESARATAVVSVYAAHVLEFQPKGQQPVLWLSQQAQYTPGQAIRGGIPIIWPWFGAHPTDASQSTHGFARRLLWTVRGVDVSPDEVALRLGLQESDETLALWPHPFDLELAVHVDAVLRLTLTTRNTGERPFTFTEAFHSYFAASEISAVAVAGLAGDTYLDQLDNMALKKQSGAIQFDGETDRVYIHTESTCRLIDQGWQRTVEISKSSSLSTIVWNPWIEKAQRMTDFGDEEYRQMVCVETGNAAENGITLTPGATHHMALHIRLVD